MNPQWLATAVGRQRINSSLANDRIECEKGKRKRARSHFGWFVCVCVCVCRSNDRRQQTFNPSPYLFPPSRPRDTIEQSFRIEPQARGVIRGSRVRPKRSNSNSNDKENRTDTKNMVRKKNPSLSIHFLFGFFPVHLSLYLFLSFGQLQPRDPIRFSRGRAMGYTSTLSCHV